MYVDLTSEGEIIGSVGTSDGEPTLCLKDPSGSFTCVDSHDDISWNGEMFETP